MYISVLKIGNTCCSSLFATDRPPVYEPYPFFRNFIQLISMQKMFLGNRKRIYRLYRKINQTFFEKDAKSGKDFLYCWNDIRQKWTESMYVKSISSCGKAVCAAFYFYFCILAWKGLHTPLNSIVQTKWRPLQMGFRIWVNISFHLDKLTITHKKKHPNILAKRCSLSLLFRI